MLRPFAMQRTTDCNNSTTSCLTSIRLGIYGTRGRAIRAWHEAASVYDDTGTCIRGQKCKLMSFGCAKPGANMDGTYYAV